ncbi:MAG TPA: endospore germination permease [Bacilli bacterium]|nr:endospore germination permease [Bacilli bacterium]
MIKPTDGKIGTRELIGLAMLTVGTKMSDMTPNLLLKQGMTAAWMLPILSGLIIVGPLLLLIHLLNKYELGLIELVYKLLGRYLGFLVAFAIFLVALTATVLDTRSYVDILGTLYFPKTPVYVIYLILVGAIFFVANRGLENIGRTAWLILPYISIALIVLVFLAWGQHFEFSFLFPLLGPGVWDLAKAGLLYNSVYGDLLVFPVFFLYVRTGKDYKKASLIGLVITMVIQVVFMMVYILVFDYHTVLTMVYPFHQLTRVVQLGRSLMNMEAIFLAFWVMSTIVRYSIYLYVTAMSFGYLFKLREFEPLLLPLTALTFMLGMIPENSMYADVWLRDKYLLRFVSIFLPLLPVLLWGVSRFRKKEATAS